MTTLKDLDRFVTWLNVMFATTDRRYAMICEGPKRFKLITESI